MVSHMKTTIQISDALLNQARELAAREDLTLKEVFEAGLRRVLEDREQTQRSFKLRKCAFKGEGLQTEFEDADWAKIRDTIYEGRGA